MLRGAYMVAILPHEHTLLLHGNTASSVFHANKVQRQQRYLYLRKDICAFKVRLCSLHVYDLLPPMLEHAQDT